MPQRSAAERTLELCDVRPQPNRAPTIVPLDGPTLRRDTLDRGPTTHLTTGGPETLCGARLDGERRRGHYTDTCALCLIEASKLRATVTR